MNNLELKAHVIGLGLTAQEGAEISGMQKRNFNYLQDGSVAVKQDVEMKFFLMASHYTLVLDKMLADVEKATVHNENDQTKPSTVKPVLPFFYSFESFQMTTECPHVTYWRIYQAVISHLILIGKITKLDDSAEIPSDFWIWKWLKGGYEHEQLY